MLKHGKGKGQQREADETPATTSKDQQVAPPSYMRKHPVVGNRRSRSSGSWPLFVRHDDDYNGNDDDDDDSNDNRRPPRQRGQGRGRKRRRGRRYCNNGTTTCILMVAVMALVVAVMGLSFAIVQLERNIQMEASQRRMRPLISRQNDNDDSTAAVEGSEVLERGIPTKKRKFNFAVQPNFREETVNKTATSGEQLQDARSDTTFFNTIQKKGMSVTEILSSISTPGRIHNRTTPQGQALDWILHQDYRRRTSEDPKLVQRYVLVLFYYEWHFHSSRSSKWPHWCWTNWLSARDECEWRGISCHPSRKGFVVSMDLSCMKRSGPFVSELGHLTTLTSIHLRISGSLPTEIGKLSKLEELSLSGAINGTIPTDIGTLKELRRLSLHGEGIHGSLPSQIGRLAHLESMTVQCTSVDGTIPTQFGDLSNLRSLSLGRNKLTGTIPTTLGNLRNIGGRCGRLQLSFNELSGTIPSQLGQLLHVNNAENDDGLEGDEGGECVYSNFEQATSCGVESKPATMDLSSNSLTGSIPSSLGQMGRLEYLYLSCNLLQGNIPPSFGKLERMRLLHLYGNHEMVGTVPNEVCDLTVEDELQYVVVNEGLDSTPTGVHSGTSEEGGLHCPCCRKYFHCPSRDERLDHVKPKKTKKKKKKKKRKKGMWKALRQRG